MVNVKITPHMIFYLPRLNRGTIEKMYNFAQNLRKIIFKGKTINDFTQILKTDE